MKNGANVNVPDVVGETALQHLCDDVYLTQFGYLIQKGASVTVTDHNGNTPMHTAAANGAVSCISQLNAAKANINAKNNNGQTPLALAKLAAQNKAASLIQQLGGKE